MQSSLVTCTVSLHAAFDTHHDSAKGLVVFVYINGQDNLEVSDLFAVRQADLLNFSPNPPNATRLLIEALSIPQVS